MDRPELVLRSLRRPTPARLGAWTVLAVALLALVAIPGAQAAATPACQPQTGSFQGCPTEDPVDQVAGAVDDVWHAGPDDAVQTMVDLASDLWWTHIVPTLDAATDGTAPVLEGVDRQAGPIVEPVEAEATRRTVDVDRRSERTIADAFEATDPIEPVLWDGVEVWVEARREGVRLHDDATDRTCDLVQDDAGSGGDTEGDVVLPVGRVAYGTLGTCRPDGPVDHATSTWTSPAWDEEDPYLAWVEAGRPFRVDLLVNVPTPSIRNEPECVVVLPGSHREHPCWIPVTPEQSGFARVVVTDHLDTQAWTGGSEAPPEAYSLLISRDVSGPDRPGAERVREAETGVASTARAGSGADADDAAGGPTIDARDLRGDARVDPPPSAWWIGLASAAAALAVWWLYRRLSRDDLLDNDLRRRIVERIAADPGVHPSDLADRLGVAHQTVRYHLRVLEEFGEVDLLRRPATVHCFLAGVHDADDRRLEPVLTSASKRALLRLLLQEGGLCIAEAARRLDRDRSTVKRQVDALEDDGVICSERRGSARVVAIVDGLREALASRLAQDG